MTATIAAAELGRGTSAIKSGAASVLRLALSALPLCPAVWINLDAAKGQDPMWAAVGIGFVIFGALAIDSSFHALRERQGFTASLWGVLGVAFLGLNAMNAIANLAAHSDHSRDANRAKMETAISLSRQRDELNERRKAQAKAAGEQTPDSIEAEIREAKAAESVSWKASGNCDPNQISRDKTRAFCKLIAELEAKKAAAVKRDELDAKLAKLDEKAEAKGEAPSTVDSFADAMADGLTAFGYQVDEKAKLAIVRARDWGKAIGVEILAAFGPAALLGLLSRGSSAPSPYELRRAEKAAEKARKAREQEEAEARRAAELEAKAAAEAREKAKADRAAKRVAAKAKEKGDPESVKHWTGSPGVILGPSHVISQSKAYDAYAADCEARGQAPVAAGRWFADELRKLGFEIRETKPGSRRFEIVGLALASHAARGGLRVVSSR